MIPAPLDKEKAYTFADYFKLAFETDEILAWFGYATDTKRLDLPRVAEAIPATRALQERLAALLPHVSLTSEAARREFLIAPVLTELVLHTGGKIRVEYALSVSRHLQGSLDFLVQGPASFLVVEAKNADLTRGFTQLAVELVAFAQATETTDRFLYGAVSVGDIWRFGVLDRQAKSVLQDLHLFRVPDDLDDLMCVLVGIVTAQPPARGEKES